MPALTFESSLAMHARRRAIDTLGNALGYCLKASYDTLTSNDDADIERSRATWQAFIILQAAHDALCQEPRP